MRYSIEPAERLRTQRGLSPEEFSIKIHHSHAAYPAALSRGYLTLRMAREISSILRVPFSQFRPLDGGR